MKTTSFGRSAAGRVYCASSTPGAVTRAASSRAKRRIDLVWLEGRDDECRNLTRRRRPLRRQRHGSLGHEVLREADLVAREAARAPETVAANLLRIARAIHPLVADGGEELRLEREGEDVEDAALARQRFHRAHDGAAEPLAVRLLRHRDRRHLGHARRVL